MKSALIVVDMLNEYDHEDAERLAESVARRAARDASPHRPRREEGTTPVVYVNDNYGDWSAGRDGDRRARARGPRA